MDPFFCENILEGVVPSWSQGVVVISGIEQGISLDTLTSKVTALFLGDLGRQIGLPLALWLKLGALLRMAVFRVGLFTVLFELDILDSFNARTLSELELSFVLDRVVAGLLLTGSFGEKVVERCKEGFV